MKQPKTIKANGVEVDRAKLLAALVNNARAQGIGMLNPSSNRVMTTEEAQAVIDEYWATLQGLADGPGKECMLRESFRFDYVWGRPIKVGEKNGEVDRADLYDRDAGYGAFDRAVQEASGVGASRG